MVHMGAEVLSIDYGTNIGECIRMVDENMQVLFDLLFFITTLDLITKMNYGFAGRYVKIGIDCFGMLHVDHRGWRIVADRSVYHLWNGWCMDRGRDG